MKPKKENTKKIIHIALVATALLMLPTYAMANPIENATEWVLNLLTDGIARSIAIIGIVVLGFMAFFGKMSGELVGRFIAGIVLVFGGAAIIDLIIAAL